VIETLLAAAEADTSDESVGHLVSEHANTLVSTMLGNCMIEQMSSMVSSISSERDSATNPMSQRVRTVALRYLGVLPSIVRYGVLHPHKSTVIRELAKAVDDPKRSVRKEAVNTR
jgi:DNA repair/transcription protein MET18/MMS19